MAKKEITRKQKIILLLIYTFRFINSKQIQEFLHHKDHRRINSWLKELVIKGYIEKDFKVVYGTLTKPAVCLLAAKGRKYIKDSFPYSFPKYLKKISSDNKASKGFRIKCQIIVDWYLTLFPLLQEKEKSIDVEGEKLRQLANGTLPDITDTPKQRKEKLNKENAPTGIDIVDFLINELTEENEGKEIISFNKRQFFTQAYFPPFILLEKLKPDIYLRKRIKTGLMHALGFVIDAYVPRFLLRYTLKRIFDVLDEESWEEDTIHSLHIHFLCPNNQIIIYMRKLITQNMNGYYGRIPLNLHFATRNQLYNQKNGKTTEIAWRTVSSDATND